MEPVRTVLGPVGMLGRGAWSSTVNNYEFLNIVKHAGGSSYVHFRDGFVPVGTLPTDPAYFTSMVDKGDQGIQGKNAVQGTATPTSSPTGERFVGETWMVNTTNYGNSFPNFGNITVPLKVGEQYTFNARFVWSGTAWILQRELVDTPPLTDYAKISGDNNSLDTIYSKEKVLALGTLINGRLISLGSGDGVTSYKVTQDFIPVLPGYILNINTAQSTNTVSVQYDEFQQPLRRLTYSAGVDFALHPLTRYLKISGLNADMAAKTVTVKAGMANISYDRKRNEQIELDRNKQSVLDNIFNPYTVIPNGNISEGVILETVNWTLSPMMMLKRFGKLVVLGVINQTFGHAMVYYDSIGTYLGIDISTAGTTDILSGKRYAVFSPPAGTVYVRYRVNYRSHNTVADLEAITITNFENWKITLVNGKFGSKLTSQDVRDIVRSEGGIDKSFANLDLVRIGDSITANLNGEGSWGIWVNGILRPKSSTTIAGGGATLTDTTPGFPTTSTGNNTMCGFIESLINQITLGERTAPNVVMMMCMTNDFSRGADAYSTPAEIGSLAYDDYMERTFMTVSPSHNVLIPLANVNRTKIAGALRYVVDRLRTVAPECVFIPITPPQSTLHNQLHAQRCVRDYKWMADRLSLPVIDAWGASGMTMTNDYGSDRYWLADQIHPFNAAGQTIGSPKLGRFVANRAIQIIVPNAPAIGLI